MRRTIGVILDVLCGGAGKLIGGMNACDCSSPSSSSRVSKPSTHRGIRCTEGTHSVRAGGYRRITALMRREGFEVNVKRVARIRREEGIKVNKKQRRVKRLGISTAERQRAERPGQVWSCDFVSHQTENGSCFRLLTLLNC